MSTQIVYSVQTVASGGQSLATVQANVAQPAFTGLGTPGMFRDESFIQSWGLRVGSDVTTNPSGNLVLRTITLFMDASAIATGTVAITKGSNEGLVTGITVTAQGLDYIQPPVPLIVDTTGKGARAACGLQVLGTTQYVKGNNLYNSATVKAVALAGGLFPGGTPATFSVTVAAGVITAVTCTNTATNGPYAYQPVIAITDSGNPAGTAQWKSQMGVHPTVSIITPGTDYTAPTVVFSPYFKQMNPDTAAVAQANAVRGWMQGILSQALGMPFGENAPVVS